MNQARPVNSAYPVARNGAKEWFENQSTLECDTCAAPIKIETPGQ